MVEKECASCDGTGECSRCDGTGEIVGVLENYTCSRCDGTGVCPACEGSGVVEVDQLFRLTRTSQGYPYMTH